MRARRTTENGALYINQILRSERPTMRLIPLGARWSLTHAVLALDEHPESVKHWLNLTDRDGVRRSAGIPSVFGD